MCIPVYCGGVQRGSYARNSLYGDKDSLEDQSAKSISEKIISVVTKCQEQMVLAQGVPKELGDETSILLITLFDFSLHTSKPEK